MPIEDEILFKYVDDDFKAMIKGKSYRSYYQFLIRYIDFYKNTYDYLIKTNQKQINQLLVDEDNKKELEILINYNRFNQSLKIYEVLENNYEANIKKATKEIAVTAKTREEFDKAQLEIFKDASIKTIMSYFTSIYKSNEELCFLSLDAYDCKLYIHALTRLDELISEDNKSINNKNND